MGLMGHRRYGTDGKGDTEDNTDVNDDTTDMGKRGNVTLKIWD
jgi:hypothetical protein